MKRAGLFCILLLTLPFWTRAFVSAPIQIDGDFSDWAVVLGSSDNTISDGAKGAGDLDSPGQTSSDLRTFAATWDDTNVYFYFRRGTTSNSGITLLVYLDRNNDGRMESGDLLLFYTFNNSGFQSFSLYAYIPLNPSGDTIGGDGSILPGTIGSFLSNSGIGIKSSTGVLFETSTSWSTLTPYGVSVKGPMLLHPSLTLGTNIPSQIEDNGDNLSTLVQFIDIWPDNEISAKPGDTVSFLHIVKNRGNAPEIAELKAVSLQGWNVSFWDSSGSAPLTDTNGNATVDTGVLGENQVISIMIKVTVPSSTPTQTNDTITVTTYPASNSSIKDEAVDTIYAGFVVTFKGVQKKTAIAGTTVPYYRQIVENLTDSEITINISTASSNGWSTYVKIDNNCDDISDSLPITQVTLSANSQICLITYLTIPSGIPWGTSDTTITSITFGNPLIQIDVNSITDVEDVFTISPNDSGSQGAGETIIYSHTIRNNQSISDTFNIASSSSLGWTGSLFESDGVTPMVDHNGDSIPDSGPLGGYGEKFNFKIRVIIPSTSTFNSQDITTVSANPTGLPGQSKNVTDTTTVKVLVTFADAAYSIPASYFASCTNINYKAFGISNGTYRFQVYDPSGTLKTLNSVQLTPDQSGQATDSYNLQSSDALGTWSVKLQQKSGSSWVDIPNYISYFDVINAGSITVATGRPVYNLQNETLSITGSATNPSHVSYLDASLNYIVFIDLNGNNNPDNGETYIKSDGTTAVYSPGAITHSTSPFDVSSNSTKSDTWSINIPNFGNTGQWKVNVSWQNICPSLISNGVTTFAVIVDFNPPISTITNPANGSSLFLSSSPFIVEGTSNDNETYVSKVEISTDNGNTWINAINTGVNFSTWNYSWLPFYRGSYTVRCRAIDAVGNMALSPTIISITVIDNTLPLTPVVTDNGNYSGGTLSAAWFSEDSNSGIDHYSYCVGTTQGLCNIVPLTNVGNQLTITRSDLPLSNGTAYYFNIIATNLDGYNSSTGSSDGIIADLLGPVTSVLDPAPAQILTGSTYTILGSASDALSGVDNVYVSTDGGSSWNNSAGTNAWSYVWNLPPDGTYTLYSRARDAVGNMGTLSLPVTVSVDNPPEPPSNLSASDTGFCQELFNWSPSPSSDIYVYRIYSDDGTGTIDYNYPIAAVQKPLTTWTSTRGIYGYSMISQSLGKESGQSQDSILNCSLINANHTDYSLSTMKFSWDPETTPAAAISKISVGGIQVYSNPIPTEGDNEKILDLAPTTIPQNGHISIEVHFTLIGGGFPEMAGKILSLEAGGGGLSPVIYGTLQVSGGILMPSLANNRTTLKPTQLTKIGIRAVDAGGHEENNTTDVISVTVCNSSPVQVALVYPPAGTSLQGDRVTFYGELISGDMNDLKEVRFEARPISGSWSLITAADAYHPNPDNLLPFITTWNADNEATGQYELRAVAVDHLDVSDLYPQTVTVSVEAVADLNEYINGTRPTAESKVTVGVGGFLKMADDVHDNLTCWDLPDGAISSDTTLITIIDDPAVWNPLIPAGYSSGNQFRDISLSSGEVTLYGGKTLAISIPYDDSDGNGIVDGTGAEAYKMIIYSYDSSISTWSPAASQVNLTTKEVTGELTKINPVGLLVPSTEPGDATPPKEVTNLMINLSGNDAILAWDPVTVDINNNPENIRYYYIYRGTAANFIPDQINHSNLYGVSTTTQFLDFNSMKIANKYFYLVVAVDASGNESEH